MSSTVPVFGPNQRFQVMDSPTAGKLRHRRGQILQHYYGSKYRVRLDDEAQMRIIDACILNHITAEDETRWAANAEAKTAAKKGDK